MKIMNINQYMSYVYSTENHPDKVMRGEYVLGSEDYEHDEDDEEDID